MGRRTSFDDDVPRKAIYVDLEYYEVTSRSGKVLDDPYILINGKPVYVRRLKGPELPAELLSIEVLLKTSTIYELYAVDDKELAKTLSAFASECGGELEVRRGVKHTYYVVGSVISRCVAERIAETMY